VHRDAPGRPTSHDPTETLAPHPAAEGLDNLHIRDPIEQQRFHDREEAAAAELR
jgi:hypothetical protein